MYVNPRDVTLLQRRSFFQAVRSTNMNDARIVTLKQALEASISPSRN
jgi:hypothetical protein